MRGGVVAAERFESAADLRAALAAFVSETLGAGAAEHSLSLQSLAPTPPMGTPNGTVAVTAHYRLTLAADGAVAEAALVDLVLAAEAHTAFTVRALPAEPGALPVLDFAGTIARPREAAMVEPVRTRVFTLTDHPARAEPNSP